VAFARRVDLVVDVLGAGLLNAGETAIDGCVETLALSNDKGFPFIQI